MTNGGTATVQAERKTSSRFGSQMSNKQIAYAAVAGRRVTFRYLFTMPAHEVTGYVVGMDDYHWMIASVLPPADRTEGEVIRTVLAHKSAQMVVFGTEDALSKESEPVIAAVTATGSGFWRHCNEVILKRPHRS